MTEEINGHNDLVTPFGEVTDNGTFVSKEFDQMGQPVEQGFSKAKITRFSGIRYTGDTFTYDKAQYTIKVSLTMDFAFVSITSGDDPNAIGEGYSKTYENSSFVAIPLSTQDFATTDLNTHFWVQELSNRASLLSETAKYVFDRDNAEYNLKALAQKAGQIRDELAIKEIANSLLQAMQTTDLLAPKDYVHLVNTIVKNSSTPINSWQYKELKDAGLTYNYPIQMAVSAIISLQDVLKKNNLLDGLEAGFHTSAPETRLTATPTSTQKPFNVTKPRFN